CSVAPTLLIGRGFQASLQNGNLSGKISVLPPVWSCTSAERAQRVLKEDIMSEEQFTPETPETPEVEAHSPRAGSPKARSPRAGINDEPSDDCDEVEAHMPKAGQPKAGQPKAG